MGKQKSDTKKKKKKSSQLVIRIEAGERDAFVKLCDKMDTTAAREIRRFMRDWVAAHAPADDKDAAVSAPAMEAPVETEPEVTPEAKPSPKSKRKASVEATA